MTDAPRPARPGARIQMADIARMAGVSASTVSRALADNPLVSARTRAHIKQIAKQAGYQVDPVASSLRSRRSSTICVAVPLMHAQGQPLSDPFMMTMLALLAEALTAHGYSMLLSRVDQHRDGWIDQLVRSRHADGIILLGQSHEHQSMNAAAREGWPMVVWGSHIKGQSYVSVGSDNRQGGELAARYLIETCHRRIAFLGDDELPEIAPRFAGYRQMLKCHGLAFDPRLHVRCAFLSEHGYQVTRAMLKKTAPPDAIFAAADVIALGAMRALIDHGFRVPQDVAVIGFDDIAQAKDSQPPLTTIAQDFEAAARYLVERLLAMIEGEPADPAQSVELPVQLVVRESA